MKTELIGGPLDGGKLVFIHIPDKITFVRNTKNIYVYDDSDPKIRDRQRHTYVRFGETLQYKQKQENKQNNSA